MVASETFAWKIDPANPQTGSSKEAVLEITNGTALTVGTTEDDAIKNECEDTNYDFNLYIVGAILNTDGTGVGGFADAMGASNAYMRSTYYTDTAAHEIGHMLGSLPDIVCKYEDDENLMSYYHWGKGPGGQNGTRLRKYQWDACNP